ncbi:MAG: prolyl oligopeptidase family serine peptidase, partial [Vicinamibacterales bacterium]
MISAARSTVRHRHQFATWFFAVAVALACTCALPFAQSTAAVKKPLGVADYTRWRSISEQSISGDGNWVTYVLQQTNVAPGETKPVLHLVNLATNQDVTVANGVGGIFSPDSKWIVYIVDPSGGRGGRGRGRAGNAPAGGDAPQAPAQAQGRGAQAPMPPKRAELRNLATGAIQTWDDVQSFVFSPVSTHLVLKRQPPAPGGNANAGRGGQGGAAQPGGNQGAAATGGSVGPEQDPRGTDVVLVDLKTGRSQILGSVNDIAFTKKGALLAYDVDATPKDSNGLFVYDVQTERVTPLDNGAKIYSRLEWSDDGTSLAVLKGADVEHKRERANVLMAFHDVQAAVGREDTAPKPVAFDASAASGVPKDWIVSDRAALTWSADDKRLFFGMKAQVPAFIGERLNTDENADVDVWNTSDDRIQSEQMIRAEQDRDFTFREAFDTASGTFVKLADETMRDIDIAQDGRWGVGRDARGYVSDYKPPAADVYRINTSTGERTLMLKNQILNNNGNHTFGISPDGHYFVYWKDLKLQAYDLDAGASKTIGASVSFVNPDFDHPGPKPAVGIAGFTKDGKAVIAEQKYDLWLVPLDGSAARNLTDGFGAKNDVALRYVKLDPPDLPTTPVTVGGGGGFGGAGGGGRGGAGRNTTIDVSKPIMLSAFGEWTKTDGFYQLADGQLKELVYDEAAFSAPVKAANADKYLFTRQTFAQFPDLHVSGPDFKDSKKISDANPQQSEYLWGHRILFDFKDHDGHRLQAMLTIPDDYKPGEKRPMLVNFYEKNTQNFYHYNAPSYLSSMGSSPMQAVSDGYLALVPDVYFHTGSSHSDMLEAVEAATRKVIEMGYADPAKIGINGHSYGGEGAAFIGTRSRLFAAVGVGAGVTDLYQDFNQNWGWSYQVSGGSGANGDDYYLYGQGRWGFSPWQKPEVYMFESAL